MTDMKVMRNLVGETLSNRYRLVAALAGGGMGEVYRGHDLLLDRKVAVKVLQPSLATSPELVARFKAEARAAARLSHPNVVAVHDWGAEDEYTYYMVMEFVSGRDLRDVLMARERLEPAHAAEIVADVCDALAAAHDIGLVHRDVKPENVIISRDGRAKVVDFGIAVVAGADLTEPGGGIPGTLRYLSPEQAGGFEATSASDIWAAGALLYELLTGSAPLQGSGAELLRRRAIEPIGGPRDLESTVPDELDSIVRQASALEPEIRYPNARTMGSDLRAALARQPDAGPLTSLLEEVTGEVFLPDMEPTTFTRSRGTRNRRRLRRMLVPGAIALLLAVVGLRAAVGLAAPDEVRVPGFIGASIGRSETRASQAGLKLEVADRRPDLKAPRGTVVAQTPDNGFLLEGETVSVVVSSGLPKVQVPEVVGSSLYVARVKLAVHGMKIGDTSDRYDLAPKGTVVEQAPAGVARWGSAIDLVVSRGPRPVAVPEVSGKSFEKAKEILAESGFEVERQEAYSNDVPKGDVISTDPPGGTTSAEGQPINVIVSIGPEFEELKMPDVRNMYVDDAEARLESMGFTNIRVVQSCGGGGTIVSETDPIAGTTVRENDRIALFVC